jgi:hypothetical protein
MALIHRPGDKGQGTSVGKGLALSIPAFKHIHLHAAGIEIEHKALGNLPVAKTLTGTRENGLKALVGSGGSWSGRSDRDQQPETAKRKPENKPAFAEPERARCRP